MLDFLKNTKLLLSEKITMIVKCLTFVKNKLKYYNIVWA